MKRFGIRDFNWKYILGEILLIFLGINLAIWFNDWNVSKAMDKDKNLAISKIKGELENNLGELLESRVGNQRIPRFMEEYQVLSKGGMEDILMTPEQMQSFQKKYASFYKITDSTLHGSGQYAYKADTFINIEIAALSKIAWETSKTTGIFKEFGFDCLYELESTYNLQEMVEREYANALEALQNDSIEQLLRVLEFVGQLDKTLERRYQNTMDNLEGCK